MNDLPLNDTAQPWRREIAGSSRSLLGMFAKWWRPGEVKTHLAATIGALAAAQFHELAVHTLLLRLQAEGDGRWLCVSPAESVQHFARLVSGWGVCPKAREA